MKGIKHIIFDLGGVLLNIDYKLTEKAFIDLGISNFPQLYSQLKQTPIFDLFETGKINRNQFIEKIRELSEKQLTDQQIINSWNAMLLHFPLRRLQILQQLQLYHNLFLLSNTNEIHEDFFNKILFNNHGIPSLGVFFNKVYLSHRIGLRKPDKEVFEFVLNSNGLIPEDTLFIDDSIQHIEGAKAVGIRTIFLEPGMTIEHNIFRAKK